LAVSRLCRETAKKIDDYRAAAGKTDLSSGRLHNADELLRSGIVIPQTDSDSRWRASPQSAE
jgi:hypothetical protein